MLTILLNPKRPEPLYRQICTAIQTEIATGHLKPHEKLPSKRTLAAHLQVSIITVQTAYEQLAAEGYLVAQPRVGYYVDPDAHLLSCQLQQAVPHTAKQTDPPQAKDWVHFSTSGVDLEQFPFTTWAKLSRQVLTNQQETLLQKLPSMGLWSLRPAIANYLYAYRNMQVSPEQILIGAGTEYLLGLLVQLLGTSRRYAVEDPGYPKVKKILRANGAAVAAIPMDQEGILCDRLEEDGASICHITPSHQFPTGKIMPLRRRAKLLQWLHQQPERYLIEDDYDSELRFHGKPLPALYSLDDSQRVIYMNTFARTLAPSLRIGYVVLPMHLAERFATSFSFYSCTVPSFEQYTLERFLQEGFLERHLNRMKKTYRQRQTILLETLSRHPMGQYIHVQGEQAGLHLLLEVHLPFTETQLVTTAKTAHVTISGLSDYYDIPDEAPTEPPCLVLGYAQLSPEEIQTGVTRCLDAWQKLLDDASFPFPTP